MKHLIALLILLLAGLTTQAYEPKTGHAVWQDAPPPIVIDGVIVGTWGPTLQAAYGSNRTHCGIVYVIDGEAYVIEAGGGAPFVCLTPWEEWKARCPWFEAKKFWFADYVPWLMKIYAEIALTRVGEEYDFSWRPYWEEPCEDDRMYCSELPVWAFEMLTGIRIGSWKPMTALNIYQPCDPYTAGVFNLPPGTTYAELLSMFFNLNTKVVTPQGLFESDWLVPAE